jgi:hypothetical protein
MQTMIKIDGTKSTFIGNWRSFDIIVGIEKRLQCEATVIDDN